MECVKGQTTQDNVISETELQHLERFVASKFITY
jgi:hypothetical protein